MTNIIQDLPRIKRLVAYAEWAYFDGTEFRYHADLMGKPLNARELRAESSILSRTIAVNHHVHLGIRPHNTLVLVFRGIDVPLAPEIFANTRRWLGFCNDVITAVSYGSRKLDWDDADREDTTALRYALVHEGFLIAFDRLRQNLYLNIRTLMEGKEPVHIEVCGHSLGGALATLCALWCTLRWPDANITCVTIGSPRVGDEHFAEEFGRHKSKIQCYRIMTDSDPIPTLPNRYTEAIPFQVSTNWPYVKFKWDTTKYRHVGRPIWLHKQHERITYLDENPPHIDHEEQASNLTRISDLGLMGGGLIPYAYFRGLLLFWNIGEEIGAHSPIQYASMLQSALEGSDWTTKRLERPLSRQAAVATVACKNDDIDLFVCGEDGKVYTSHWCKPSNWPRWESLGGEFPAAAPVAVVARKDNHIDLFVCGKDGKVYTSHWHECSDWTGWKSLGGEFPEAAPVAMVTRKDDHIDLFVCGKDGKVYTSHWHECSDWTRWKSLGGEFPAAAPVAVVARTDDHIDLFVCGKDRKVYTSHWHERSDWTRWESLGGEFPAAAPVAVVARKDNHIDLFVCGKDGKVYTSHWHERSDWTGWKSLGGEFPEAAPVAAVARKDDHLDLFVCQETGTVFTIDLHEWSVWASWISLGAYL